MASFTHKSSSLHTDFGFEAADNATKSEIQILVADSDAESLFTTGKKLSLNQYEVNLVVSGSMALKNISDGKKKFDMVAIDVNLSDMESFQLCNYIEKMGILVVVTSTRDDPMITYKALENGASLLVKKPLDDISVKYMHQLLIKQKIIKTRKVIYGETRSVENIIPFDGIPLIDRNNEDAVQKKRKYQRNVANEGGMDQQTMNVQVFSSDILNKKKMCVEWTEELHQKFMDAVSQLGEGKCYPKEILELMDVPGLTRMHVASHLQKCRYDNWRNPAGRQRQSRKSHVYAHTNVPERGPDKVRLFDSMPNVDHNSFSTVQKNHYLSVPAFGNKPVEQVQTSCHGNGTRSNFFTTPITYFPSKEKFPERWIEHVPIEVASRMWTSQGGLVINPTSHQQPLPHPTFNIVPSMASNSNTIHTNFSSIHVTNDGVNPTKEAMMNDTNYAPSLKIFDVLTGECSIENEEANFLLPELPNFAPDNYEFHYENAPNPSQPIGYSTDKATGHNENVTRETTSSKKAAKDV